MDMLEGMGLPKEVKDLVAALSGKEYKEPMKKKRKRYVDDEEYMEMMGKGKRPEEEMMDEEYAEDEENMEEEYAMDEEKEGDDEYEMAEEEEEKPKRKKRLGFSVLMALGKGKNRDASRE